MRFSVLGRLSADRDGSALPALNAPMVRRLLAALLTKPNSYVTTEDLVLALWGEEAPPSARKTLQVYVRRLRSALGDDQRIVHRPGGYGIVVHEGELDAAEFARFAAAGNLTAALSLWQGNAYEDVREHPPIADEARRLDEERLRLQTRHSRQELDAGRHAELIPQLTQLIEAHPFHEDFRAQLMLALYRSGRQSEALEVFRNTRRLLDTELGVEPGTELQRLHEAILRADPALNLVSGPNATVPRELPADISGFVGRERALEVLGKMLSEKSPVIISAIAGTAGVGKSALAVHWAHQVAGHFPDGQLHINLRGFDPASPPLGAGEVIRRFLDALGVSAQRIPAGLEAQVALYRSLLADKRMLVILDNAHDAEQVRPLLPGSPTCLVIITSRVRLASLVATNNARPVMLDVLSHAEAESMLSARLGADRVSAAPGAVQRIIERCARLPLALAIASARAATEPSLSLAELATQLEDVHAFNSDDDPMTDLRAVFTWSYQQLSPAAARLFRLLGLHPGPDISAAAAASLAGQPVQRELAELTHAHMLSESVSGRYTFHDLLRAYATDLSEAEDILALGRVLEHYACTSDAADRLLNPHRKYHQPPREIDMERLETPDDAMAWFNAERSVLLAAIRKASHVGLDTYIPSIAASSAVFLDRCGLWNEMALFQELALSAAQRINDKGHEANAYRYLARSHSLLNRQQEALRCLQSALELYDSLGDHMGQGDCHMGLTSLLEIMGRPAEGLFHAKMAYENFKLADHRSAQANALNSIGYNLALTGSPKDGLVYCQRALILLEETGDVEGQGHTLDSIAYSFYRLADYEKAIEYYGRAVKMYEAANSRYCAALAIEMRGESFSAVGDRRAATDQWRQALQILEEIGHHDAGRLRHRLTAV